MKLGAEEAKVVQTLQEQEQGERLLPYNKRKCRRLENGGWKLEKGKWQKRKHHNMQKTALIDPKDENKETLTTEEEHKPYFTSVVMYLLIFVYISVLVCL